MAAIMSVLEPKPQNPKTPKPLDKSLISIKVDLIIVVVSQKKEGWYDSTHTFDFFRKFRHLVWLFAHPKVFVCLPLLFLSSFRA